MNVNYKSMPGYFLVFLLALNSCNSKRRQFETPKAFINHVTVDKKVYSSDSIAILTDLYVKMKNHTASFSNPEYFDSTVLFIDTIMYDSSLNKIAVFLAAQNPTYRNPYSRSKLPYYYHANCYLGKRLKDDSSLFDLKCLCLFNEVNFDNYETVIKALKEDFFYELTSVRDEKDQPVFNYNLNDTRFWESPTGWRRTFK